MRWRKIFIGCSQKKGNLQMSNNIMEALVDLPAEHERNIFGQFDEHLKIIERTLNVTLIARDGVLKILGNSFRTDQAKRLMLQLLELSKRGNMITKQNINYALSLLMEEKESALTEIDSDLICNTIQGRPIKPKTLGQKNSVDQIRKLSLIHISRIQNSKASARLSRILYRVSTLLPWAF